VVYPLRSPPDPRINPNECLLVGARRNCKIAGFAIQKTCT
jgi:hypothetical protein